MIIRLSGGDKSSQQADIVKAKEIAKQLEGLIMAIKTTRWDPAEYLQSDEDIKHYLEACFEEAGDDPAFIVHALGVIARAKNMSQLARDTGITCEGL